jgi:tRNA-specific 2-thiouridylase
MRVAALTSGGVDSALALARLVEAGHDVHAFYLKVWLEDELEHLGECPWEDDLRYARAVARQFGVPLTVIPLQRAYREGVVAYLLEELERGGTPSPDLFCNARIKFGAFADWVDAEVPGGRFERVATGHYARRIETADGVELHRAPDPVKDQTYFLSRISVRQLERSLFPVGGLQKTEVRRSAAQLGLAPRERPDSQGICFLGGVRYRDFVTAHLGERPGAVVDEATGDRIGTHRGHWLFTIGQRRGLGLSGGPWFVAGKDPRANRVVVRRGAGRPVRRILLEDLHWIGGGARSGSERLQVRVRHGPELADAQVSWDVGGRGELLLDQPDEGLAPGQFAVLYRGVRCLGSGRITLPSAP